MHSILRKTTVISTVLLLTVVSLFSLPSSSAEDFAFVNISDVHVPGYGSAIGMSLDEESLMLKHNPQRIQQFANECLEINPKPDFVMNTGDTGDAGWIPLLKLYQKLMQPLVKAGIPVYTVVGNHDLDYAGIGRQDLAEMFDPLGPSLIGRSGSRYSFEHKGCHLIVMNNRPISGLIRFNPMDIEWLRQDLESVDNDTRILLFMHANVPVEDTHHIVELVQHFDKAVIFHGHNHRDAIDSWGGVPVIKTNCLYGGNPKSGSYKIVTVHDDKITFRTRDFSDTDGTLDEEITVDFSVPATRIRVIAPEYLASAEKEITLKLETDPANAGTMEYSLPGFSEWATVQGSKGKFETTTSLPDEPGRHLITFRFTGENGTIALAHRVIKVPGQAVREAWSKNLGSAVQGAPVIVRDRAIIPTIEGGVFALRLDDGSELWHREVGQGQILGRSVTDGRAYYYGAGRDVIACDVMTGKTLWQTTLKGTVVAGLTAGTERIFVPAGEGAIYCIDTGNGNILWEYQANQPIIMEAETNGSMVFFGSMDGNVRALDSMTGKEVWKKQVSSMEDKYTTAPFWPPVVAGDVVISGKIPADKEENNLTAYSVSNGDIAWARQLSGGTYRLAVHEKNDSVFSYYRGNQERGVQCFSAKDGSSLWNGATGVVMNSGAVTRDEVLTRDSYNVACVDAASGETIWIYKTSTGPQGSYYGPGAMAARGKLTIVGTMDGEAIALKW